MQTFRDYLTAKPKGEATRLAKAVGVTHAQISRIADGHRSASLSVAVALAKATSLPAQAFLGAGRAVPTGYLGKSATKPGKNKTVTKRANGRGRR